MIFDPGKRELYDSYGAEQLYGEESSELEGGTLFPFPAILDVRDCETWEKRFGSLYREFIDSGGSNQFYLKTGVLQLLLHLKEEAASAAGCPASVHYPAIMAVKSHIDREPSARFCLAELAKRAGMSRSFFCSQFTKIVGISPIAYGNLARIRLAKRLLLQTHLSATEISYECGFETTTYFFRVFKKIVGVTPAQYRDRTNHNYNWFWCKN
jgi:AraC-like DNA-binding protein